MLVVQWGRRAGGERFLVSNVVNPTKAVLRYVFHQQLAFPSCGSELSSDLVSGASGVAPPSTISCFVIAMLSRERLEMNCSYDRILFRRFYFFCTTASWGEGMK